MKAESPVSVALA